MGTAFTILLYTDDEATARRASRAAFDRIAELDRTLTDYNPESELMRLCARAGGPPVAVSRDLFDVLERSKDLYERSGGAFDVTVAPVVRLWRRARRDRTLPAPELIAKARALVGADAILLDREARTVQLTRPGMKLDVGGIAKGYASGEAIRVLGELGIKSALVAGSGDIVVSGPPPGREGWTIAVAPLKPEADGDVGRSILLANAAVSTSGDAEQFVEIGGVRYSHVLDPSTGLGLTERRSVTVIATEGIIADGLDTAACVLGPDKGLALIESSPGAAGLFVRIKPDGTQEVRESGGWSRWAIRAARP
ncbi:FAD:protein FMN transferase [Tundrisphaera lichenicola]|uniref:FAD:protein FMN transferase n=1 Tax=Tundrisphaera lichenicola TaxID=2029860 RepID=UPI003EBF6ABE